MKPSEIDKTLHHSLKTIGKKYGWKSCAGFLFIKKGPLFFVSLILLRENKIDYTLNYKFFDFDEVFWNIVDFKENIKKPLSFHARGVWTVPTREIYRNISSEIDDWSENIFLEKLDDILQEVEKISSELAKKITNLDENLEYLENLYADIISKNPQTSTNIYVEKLITAILKNEFPLAFKIIEERIAQCDGGGFIAKRESFYVLAKKYIKSEIRQNS